MTSLFEPHSEPVTLPDTWSRHRSPFSLREYQREDVEATLAAWESGKRGVLCCWATGTGKSIFFAELSKRIKWGRVLVVVDTTKLATDLYRTIIKHHGVTPGMLTGDLKSNWQDAQVVVATIQSVYAGKAGDETYRLIDPTQFAAVLCDETESALADQFGATIQYFLDGNPDLKIAGASATPFRTDGREMGELFDHCAPKDPQTGRAAIGVLNRNLKWAYLNGWLVKPRQAFLTCNVDFSSIKIRKRADGERDWSDKDIAQLLMDQDEQEMRTMAEGIAHMAKDKQSVVVCPNNVELCKIVAGHLCGAMNDDDAAQAVYGLQGEYGRDLMEAHARGDYQHMVTCKMAEKGYDCDSVVYAFMLRKTQSRRLYEQILGRVLRPLESIRPALAEAPDEKTRMKIIAESGKPFGAMVDLAGIDPDTKEIGVIDIIGDYLPDELRRRTMELMHRKDQEAPEPGTHEDDEDDTQDVGEVARQALKELAEEREAQEREEREQRRKRSLIQVSDRNVNVEWSDDMTRQGNTSSAPRISRGSATDGQCMMMIALGVKPENALKMHKFKAMKTIDKLKNEVGKPLDWSKVNAFERESGIKFERKKKGAA